MEVGDGGSEVGEEQCSSCAEGRGNVEVSEWVGVRADDDDPDSTFLVNIRCTQMGLLIPVVVEPEVSTSMVEKSGIDPYPLDVSNEFVACCGGECSLDLVVNAASRGVGGGGGRDEVEEGDDPWAMDGPACSRDPVVSDPEHRCRLVVNTDLHGGDGGGSDPDY